MIAHAIAVGIAAAPFISAALLAIRRGGRALTTRIRREHRSKP